MATLDFSGFAPQLSPGQSDTGGFTAPTVDDPLTSGTQTGNAGSSGLFGLGGQALGVNWGNVAKALGGSDPAGGGGQQSQSLPNLPVQAGQAGTAQASSGAVGAARAPSLDALVQMLMAKTNAYRAAANPRTALPVLGLKQPAGLLGL